LSDPAWLVAEDLNGDSINGWTGRLPVYCTKPYCQDKSSIVIITKIITKYFNIRFTKWIKSATFTINSKIKLIELCDKWCQGFPKSNVDVFYETLWLNSMVTLTLLIDAKYIWEFNIFQTNLLPFLWNSTKVLWYLIFASFLYLSLNVVAKYDVPIV